MRCDSMMMATTWRALCNPVTILGGGRDLADMQDTRDIENAGNMGDSPAFSIIVSQTLDNYKKI